jgi:hypothetical protein
MYPEGDAASEEVVGEDDEGGAVERRRAADVAVAVVQQLVDAGVSVTGKGDLCIPRPIPFQHYELFLTRDGNLLPAIHAHTHTRTQTLTNKKLSKIPNVLVDLFFLLK